LTQVLCGCFIVSLFEGDVPFAEADLAEWYEDGDPIIRPGLVLRLGVTASGAPVVQETLQEVNSSGDILLALVGSVKCEGLTLLGAQDKIAEAYKAFVIEPQVTVSFAYTPNSGMKSPWGSVLMMGAIGRRGPVDMTSTRDLTVTRALMQVGNVTAMGDETRVRVARRHKDGTLQKFKVNVEKIGKQGRLDLDLKLRPGDVVYVPETWY